GVGHSVLFGSRDPQGQGGPDIAGRQSRQGTRTQPPDFAEAVLYTVRDVLTSALLGGAKTLAGPTVIDRNNSAILALDVSDPDRRPCLHFTKPPRALAKVLAADVPGACAVRAVDRRSPTALVVRNWWTAQWGRCGPRGRPRAVCRFTVSDGKI